MNCNYFHADIQNMVKTKIKIKKRGIRTIPLSDIGPNTPVSLVLAVSDGGIVFSIK